MSIVREDGYTREQGVSSVGKGWAGLVDRAFDAVPSDAKIVQVKEKFGKLRIYAEPRDIAAFEREGLDGFIDMRKEFFDLLTALEIASARICEDCGKPGMTQLTSNGGWVRTVCAEHTKSPEPK